MTEPNCIVAGRGAARQEPAPTASETRRVIDNPFCGVAIIGPDRGIRFANTMAARLLGLPAGELAGSTFASPLIPGEVAETTVSLADGQTARIESRVAEIEWDGEQALLVSLQDITARVRAEALLQENEARFRTVLESAAIGISVDSFEGRPILANPALQKMLGYTEDELRGMVYTEFTYPDDREPEARLYQELLSGKRDSYQFEKRYIRKDGQIIWGGLTVSLLHQAGQPPTHFVAMVEDITERKRTKDELAQSEERWRSLAENAPDVILTVDPSGSIKYANRGFQGIPPDQLVGRKVYACVLLEHRDQLRQLFEQVLASARPARYEFSGVGTASGLAWHVANVAPIVVQEAVVGATAVISDISDRKRMEDELRDTARRLAVFREIDQAILAAQSPVSIVEGALQHIQELVPCDWAGVAIMDDDRDAPGALIVREGNTLKSVPDAAAVFAALNLARLGEGQSHAIGDIEGLARLNPLEQMFQGSSRRAYALLPLLTNGELLGILGVASRFPGAFKPDHLTIAAEVADLLAVAIQQARLLSQSQRRAAELEVLAQVSAALRQAETYPEMHHILVEQTRVALQAETCGLFLIEDDRFVLVAGHGPCESPADCDVPTDQHCFRQVVSTGQPLCLMVSASLENRPPREPCGPCAAFAPGVPMLALVPLRTSTSATIGLLSLGFRHRDALESGKDRLFTAMADIASNALQRAKTLHTLEQRVSDRTRKLRVLYLVSAATSEAYDLSKMLASSLESVLATIPESAGCVQLLDEGAPGHVLTVEHGLNPSGKLICDLRRGFEAGTPWGQVLGEGLSLRMTKGIAERRLPEVIQYEGFQAYLGVPIRASGQTVGVLSVFLRGKPRLAVDDLEVLSAVAGQLGRTVERTELRRKAEEAIVAEERQRLARDLHDSITQLLCSQALLAEASRKLVEAGDGGDASPYLRQLVATAHQALKEMRLMIYDLRPSALEMEGLAGAIQRRLEAVEQRAGIQATLMGALTVPLSRQEEEGLYRVAQELLNNVLKHAEATSVTVCLRESDGRVELEVADNGKGFDPAASSAGVGLRSILERVERLGGTLMISSRACGERGVTDEGVGCRVTVSLRSAGSEGPLRASHSEVLRKPGGSG